MKLIKKSNFRVVVEPKRLGDYGFLKISDSAFGRTESDIEKEYLNRCRDIEHEIKKHVDNVGSINIEYDRDIVCSHCNLTWEVSEDDSDPEFPKGTPVCCTAAIEEHKANK